MRNSKPIHQLPGRRQRGMSIIELILGTAVLATVLVSALLLLNQSESQTTGRSQADSIDTFRQLAGQYFISNRADIETAMGGDADKQAIHCRVNVNPDDSGGTVSANNTKRTCAFDSSLLHAKKMWPAGLSVNASQGGRYVAVVRQIMNSGTPTGADEMLIVLAPLSGGNVMTSGTVSYSGDAKRALDEIRASMSALGGAGGYVPPGTDHGECQYNGTTKQACGNGWKVTLSDFVN